MARSPRSVGVRGRVPSRAGPCPDPGGRGDVGGHPNSTVVAVFVRLTGPCSTLASPLSTGGAMIGREKRVLLRHYLEQGMTKPAIARHVGVSRDTIYRWIATGQLDRDLDDEAVRYRSRAPVPSKLDPYKAIIDVRLAEYPKLAALGQAARADRGARLLAPDVVALLRAPDDAGGDARAGVGVPVLRGRPVSSRWRSSATTSLVGFGSVRPSLISSSIAASTVTGHAKLHRYGR